MTTNYLKDSFAFFSKNGNFDLAMNFWRCNEMGTIEEGIAKFNAFV